PPRSPLFPYTTLFRSREADDVGAEQQEVDAAPGELHPAILCGDRALPSGCRRAAAPGYAGLVSSGGIFLRVMLGLQVALGLLWRSEEHTSELQSLAYL